MFEPHTTSQSAMLSRAVRQSTEPRAAVRTFSSLRPASAEEIAPPIDEGKRQFKIKQIFEHGVKDDSALSVMREWTDAIYPNDYVAFGEHDAFAARLNLRETPAYTIVENGRDDRLAARPHMHTMFRDLGPALHWRADHLLDQLSFVVPTTALERWARDAGVTPFGGLKIPPNDRRVDEVIKGFGLAVLPCLEQPELAPRLFVDHVLQAVCTYLARNFGTSEACPRHKGGLAPWQERRAKEMISANLDGQLSLQILASECRLSVSHFTKAFRETLGQSAHQWLLDRRCDQAKTLLITSSLSLSEIASACGFADQSHFNRTFAKRAGASPGAWRRAQGVGSADYPVELS